MSAKETVSINSRPQIRYGENHVDKTTVVSLGTDFEQAPSLQRAHRERLFHYLAHGSDLPHVLSPEYIYHVTNDPEPMEVITLRFPKASGEKLDLIQDVFDAKSAYRLGLRLATSLKETQTKLEKKHPGKVFGGHCDLKPHHVTEDHVLDWESAILLPDLPPFTGFYTPKFASLAHLELEVMTEAELRMLPHDVVSIVKLIMWSTVGDSSYPYVNSSYSQFHEPTSDTNLIREPRKFSASWISQERQLIHMIDTLLLGRDIAENDYYNVASKSISQIDVWPELLEILKDVLVRDINAYEATNQPPRMSLDEFLNCLSHLDTESFVGVLKPHAFSRALTLA